MLCLGTHLYPRGYTYRQNVPSSCTSPTDAAQGKSGHVNRSLISDQSILDLKLSNFVETKSKINEHVDDSHFRKVWNNSGSGTQSTLSALNIHFDIVTLLRVAKWVSSIDPALKTLTPVRLSVNGIAGRSVGGFVGWARRDAVDNTAACLHTWAIWMTAKPIGNIQDISPLPNCENLIRKVETSATNIANATLRRKV